MADNSGNTIYTVSGNPLSTSTNWMRKYRIVVYVQNPTQKIVANTPTIFDLSSAPAAAVLAKAASFIGVKESPPNSNNVQFNTDYYGHAVSGSNVPWCCAFVWDVFRLAGASSLFYGGNKTASCAAIENYAKSNSQWVTSGYKPGDCPIMNFHRSSAAEHIGIVEKVNADGTLTTIEGNTGGTSDSNGGEVMRRTRSTSVVLGAYRPKYLGSSATVTTVSTSTIKSNGTLIQSETGDIALDVSNLRCTFEITRRAMYYPPQAMITIYNLTADTENAIIQEGYRVQVFAGYGAGDNDNLYGQIFDGIVLMCNRWKENGTDYKLQILALDGAQFINEGYCSFTYEKGQTARSAVKSIANQASCPIQIGYISSNLDNVSLSRGMAINGLAKNTLNEIAKSCNATWFVDNGQLNVISYADSSDQIPFGKEVVELSETSGLIGNPQQVDQGINARCLLNPKIAPYSLIHINNELITQQLVNIGTYSQGISTPWLLDPEGVYRVVSVKFTGDTRGNEWYADINAVTQSGNIPELLQGANGTLN